MTNLPIHFPAIPKFAKSKHLRNARTNNHHLTRKQLVMILAKTKLD